VAVDTEADVVRLRGLVRDLVALWAIPPVWIGKEPPAVATGLADALVGLLQLDFVFVRFCDPDGDEAVEVTRGRAWQGFPEWLEGHLGKSVQFTAKEIVPDVGDDSQPYQRFAIPIGVRGEGGLAVAACKRSDFPTATERLLLSLAANQAAASFQSARLIHERRRAEEELRQARNDLEVKVAERTAELRRSQAYLAEAQRLTHTGSFAIRVSTEAITHSSDEHSRLYGFDPEQGIPSLDEILGRIHPQDRARCTEALARGIREARKIEVEYRVVPPQGPVKHHRVVAHPVFDAAGELEEFVGTLVDVTERRQAEEERRAQLWFLESLDSISRAIQRTSDLEQMLGAVLDVVLAIFDCDRAWLVYPCGPEVDFHRLAMERAQPEFIGVFGRDATIPNDEDIAGAARAVRASSGPVRFDPESGHSVPSWAAENFSVRSMIAMAVYPKMDKPYMFGLHQCSHARIWTSPEERLFQEIGRRLADALDKLLMLRDVRESERKLEGSRAELAASRARIVVAADEERRRVVRDLHDGAQQRLVHTVITLEKARETIGEDASAAARLLDEALGHGQQATRELRELAHGIMPHALARGGLPTGLRSLASRSPLPVTVDVPSTRFADSVEATAYFVVAEALTNVAKHARANEAWVTLSVEDEVLVIEVRDDGVGGASATGSGLVGMQDRLAAVNGALLVVSRSGDGTTIAATIPISAAASSANGHARRTGR
jgi:PAS domain S-box-containing protein